MDAPAKPIDDILAERLVSAATRQKRLRDRGDERPIPHSVRDVAAIRGIWLA
jgi:hypothetical protein